MFVHTNYAVRNLNEYSVVLWSVDSDVAAICPIIAHPDINLFFRTGVIEQKRYIPMYGVAS